MGGVATALCAVVVAGCAVVPAAAAAADIYKCEALASVTYQSMPCAMGQAQTVMVLGAAPTVGPAGRAAGALARVDAGTDRPDSVGRGFPRTRGAPWGRRPLALGMSDDEVLNLPGWGPPAQISRTRVSRGWRERWTYGHPVAGVRQLEFFNARLADIVEFPAAAVVSSLPQAARD